MYYETFPDPTSAIAFEKKVKEWSRAKKQALIEANWSRIKELSICKNETHHDLKWSTLRLRSGWRSNRVFFLQWLSQCLDSGPLAAKGLPTAMQGDVLTSFLCGKLSCISTSLHRVTAMQDEDLPGDRIRRGRSWFTVLRFFNLSGCLLFSKKATLVKNDHGDTNADGKIGEVENGTEENKILSGPREPVG